MPIPASAVQMREAALATSRLCDRHPDACALVVRVLDGCEAKRLVMDGSSRDGAAGAYDLPGSHMFALILLKV